MRAIRAWLLRLGATLHKGARDKDLSEELESHVQMHIEDNLRRGMNAQEARREALMKLGGVTQTAESYRERRGVPLVETLLQDLPRSANAAQESGIHRCCGAGGWASAL